MIFDCFLSFFDGFLAPVPHFIVFGPFFDCLIDCFGSGPLASQDVYGAKLVLRLFYCIVGPEALSLAGPSRTLFKAHDRL